MAEATGSHVIAYALRAIQPTDFSGVCFGTVAGEADWPLYMDQPVRFTPTEPSEGWTLPGYDDSDWFLSTSGYFVDSPEGDLYNPAIFDRYGETRAGNQVFGQFRPAHWKTNAYAEGPLVPVYDMRSFRELRGSQTWWVRAHFSAPGKLRRVETEAEASYRLRAGWDNSIDLYVDGLPVLENVGLSLHASLWGVEVRPAMLRTRVSFDL